MNIEIRNRYDNKVIICGEYESIKDCLEKNRGADLGDANLGGANLRGAYLGGANLRGADLGDADLGDADLRGANLRGANLRGANLRGANLRGAYLGDADLRGANLRGANLRGADLGGANLRGANLRGANLRGADLGDADLGGAKEYINSHDFWFEIIHRQKVEDFTEKEWAIIGQIFFHRICWDSIKKRYGKKIMPICKKLTKVGFSEWEIKYAEMLKGE